MAKVLLATLALATMATTAEDGSFTGFMYAQEKDVAALVKAGHAEVNKEIIDAAGAFAVRASAAGLEAYKLETAKAAAKAAGIEIEEGVPMPEFKRAGGGKKAGSSRYPFDALSAGQSFFVENTEKMPDAYKSLASSVTAANERHSEVIEGQTRVNRKGATVPATRQLREFKVVRATKTIAATETTPEVVLEGCRVYRIA